MASIGYIGRLMLSTFSQRTHPQDERLRGLFLFVLLFSGKICGGWNCVWTVYFCILNETEIESARKNDNFSSSRAHTPNSLFTLETLEKSEPNSTEMRPVNEMWKPKILFWNGGIFTQKLYIKRIHTHTHTPSVENIIYENVCSLFPRKTQKFNDGLLPPCLCHFYTTRNWRKIHVSYFRGILFLVPRSSSSFSSFFVVVVVLLYK